MTDSHQTSGQNYSSWKNLILNTLVLAVVGWFFLFMLPRFFDFADEPKKSDMSSLKVKTLEVSTLEINTSPIKPHQYEHRGQNSVTQSYQYTF